MATEAEGAPQTKRRKVERKPWSPNISDAESESSPLRLQLSDTSYNSDDLNAMGEIEETVFGNSDARVNKDVYAKGSDDHDDRDPLTINVSVDEANDMPELILAESSGEEMNAEDDQERVNFLFSFSFIFMSNVTSIIRNSKLWMLNVHLEKFQERKVLATSQGQQIKRRVEIPLSRR